MFFRHNGIIVRLNSIVHQYTTDSINITCVWTGENFCVTHFIVIYALLWWSGNKATLPPRYVYRRFLMKFSLLFLIVEKKTEKGSGRNCLFHWSRRVNHPYSHWPKLLQEWLWHFNWKYCTTSVIQVSEVTQSCRLFATPRTVAYQAPQSMGFSRQ